MTAVIRFEPSLKIAHTLHQATGEETDAIYRARATAPPTHAG